MSCRTRCDREQAPPRPVTCAACGSGPLDVVYSSTATGLHLCPACFAQRVERGPAGLADR